MIPCASKDFKCLTRRCLKALGCQIRYEIKSRGRLAVNFSLLSYETTKLGPQRITVKSSEMSWPPLLTESSNQKYMEKMKVKVEERLAKMAGRPGRLAFDQCYNKNRGKSIKIIFHFLLFLF